MGKHQFCVVCGVPSVRARCPKCWVGPVPVGGSYGATRPGPKVDCPNWWRVGAVVLPQGIPLPPAATVLVK